MHHSMIDYDDTSTKYFGHFSVKLNTENFDLADIFLTFKGVPTSYLNSSWGRGIMTNG